MARSDCPRCGSADVTDTETTTGPHFAKRTCGACGAFVAWVPFPRTRSAEMPAELAPFAVAGRAPVDLRGTPAQAAAARGVRACMVWTHRKAGNGRYADLLNGVADATWFLANRGLAPPQLKCWPRVDQMAPLDGVETESITR